MPTSALSQFSNTARLSPLYDEEAPVHNVTLKAAASATDSYPRGQLLGELVGNDEIQTVTLANATGGTFTLTFGGQTTAAIAFNATAAAVEEALELLSSIGENNVVVTGSAGGPYTVTFTNALGRQNVAQLTASGASLTGSSPTITPATGTGGSAGTAGTFKKYDPDATDGSQKAKCILQYAVTVDTGGLITPPGEWGYTEKAAPAYIGGVFRCEDLTGLTEAAVTDLGGVIVQGTVTKGILKF